VFSAIKDTRRWSGGLHVLPLCFLTPANVPDGQEMYRQKYTRSLFQGQTGKIAHLSPKFYREGVEKCKKNLNSVFNTSRALVSKRSNTSEIWNIQLERRWSHFV